MREWIPTYIGEVKKQRQHLRSNMSEAEFRTWHAHMLSILVLVPGTSHFQRRFNDVLSSNAPLGNRIQESRQILTSIVNFIESPLFAMGGIPSELPTQISSTIVSPQMMQIQNVTQSISIDLETLLRRVDDQDQLSSDEKEQAKGLVRQLWDELTRKAKDIATITDIVIRLGSLGVNVQNILAGLQLG